MGRDHKRRSELLDAMEKAVEWYHQRLLTSPDAGPARDYLRSRGYDGDVVRQFRLGWAPDDWDALAKALRLPENVLSDSGLGFINRRGRVQDFFRGPRALPDLRSLRASRGIGRAHPAAAAGPATVRSSRAQVQELAGVAHLFEAPHPLRAQLGQEGRSSPRARSWCARATPTSSACFQAGVPWAVATCGTALAEEHFTLLRNFAKRIVLAYDADAAGQSATSRVYEWERKHEVDVVVADLPGGSDPGELARTDPTALARAIKEARPFLQFRVDRMLASRGPEDGRGPGAGSRGGPDRRGGAPRRSGPRPVRHAACPTCVQLDRAKLRERLDYLRAHPPAEKSGQTHRVARRTSRRCATTQKMTANSMDPEGGGGGAALTAALRPGPGLEALKLAVHRPEDVVDRVHAVLFTDRCAAAGICRAAGERQRARSSGVRVTGGGKPVATRHSRRADVR